MKRLLLVALVLLSPLAAQEQKKPEDGKAPPSASSGPNVQKIFILKYAEPNKIATLLQVFAARAIPNSDLHALAVTANPEVMPAIEDAIKRLDVPSAATPNIELTAYFLIGGDGEGAPGGAPPKELDSVIVQLKNSFPFKTYHQLDVLTLRTRAGQAADTTSNTGSVGPNLPGATNSFKIRSATLSADGATVRLDNMHVGIRMPALNPGGPNFSDLGLSADVDIKEGQKVVVGRLSVNKDQALFLVLTARVVN
ncbi:MAG TPA: hypothetical protein VGF16_16830 [Bryobacteraceae bacterium]|jgi:hypothetical protein